MLVLTRKLNQKVFIDGTIEIRVLGTRGNSVKLGFVCPPDVEVHREEVLQRIVANANEEGGCHAPSRFTGTEESRADTTMLSQPT
jgi:carbon storage regulator